MEGDLKYTSVEMKREIKKTAYFWNSLATLFDLLM